jgi:hypothetical protein
MFEHNAWEQPFLLSRDAELGHTLASSCTRLAWILVKMIKNVDESGSLTKSVFILKFPVSTAENPVDNSVSALPNYQREWRHGSVDGYYDGIISILFRVFVSQPHGLTNLFGLLVTLV